MYVYKPKPHDGYYEAQIALERNLPPVLLARAVLNNTGTYDVIVRDAQSGRMVASGSKDASLLEAMEAAIEKAFTYLHLNPLIPVKVTFLDNFQLQIRIEAAAVK